VAGDGGAAGDWRRRRLGLDRAQGLVRPKGNAGHFGMFLSPDCCFSYFNGGGVYWQTFAIS